MLDVIRRGRRWGTALVVILVGGVFVIYFGLGGPLQCAPTGTVVEVDGRTFHRDDFMRVQERQEARLREAAGDAFDPDAARDFLRSSTVNMLVTRAILAAEAERMGLGVTVEEIRERVRSDPGFRDETGQFRVDAYESWVQYEYGSEARFLEMQSMELLALKLVRLLGEVAHVSEAEALQAARHREEEVRIAFVAFDPAGAVDPEAIPAEQAAAFAAANPEAIRQRYEARPERWEVPAAVRVRHILIRTGPDADEAAVEQARARAEAALERIREGADFADVALEVSDDASSREQGGDLGFVPPVELAPTLRSAAVELEPGQVSGVLSDDAGFHLIRLEELRPAGRRSQDEVAEELARELLAEEQGGEDAREQAEALRAAIAEGASLEGAAREMGLTVERTGWLRRRADGFVPGLGASLELQAAAFALEPPESAERIFEVEGRLALVQALERREPDPETLEAVAAAERENLLSQEKDRLLRAWVDRRRAELRAEGRLAVNLDLLERPAGPAPF